MWAISSLTHPTDMRSGSCRQTTELVLHEWKRATLRAAVLRVASYIQIPGACVSDAFRAVFAKKGFHQSMDRFGDRLDNAFAETLFAHCKRLALTATGD